MSNWLHIHRWLLFLLVYCAALVVIACMNRREFKRSPEKGQRYSKLPLRYKLLCWVIVVPLFAGSILEPALLLASMVALAIVQEACTRWYRKAGLLEW